MNEFKESKFYKLLQDFFINNDKETFLQMLAEFYNRTEGIIDKNNVQDDLIKELRELYLMFNEKGIDENIVREKVNYFVENNGKIADIISKLTKNTNDIKNINSQMDTKVVKQYVYVEDFGAIGDYNETTNEGTDNTQTIQRAIDYAFENNISVVKFGSKGYVIKGQIIVKEGITLLGTRESFTQGLSSDVSYGSNRYRKIFETTIVIQPTDINITPLVFNSQSGIKNMSIVQYQNFAATSETQIIKYANTITARDGFNAYNIRFIGAYNFIYARGESIHIEKIYGYAFGKAIVLERSDDVSRIKDIHLNPNVTRPTTECIQLSKNREDNIALEMIDCDGVLIDNFFCILYRTGIKSKGNSIIGQTQFSLNNFFFDMVGLAFDIDHDCGWSSNIVNGVVIYGFSNNINNAGLVKFNKSNNDTLITCINFNNISCNKMTGYLGVDSVTPNCLISFDYKYSFITNFNNITYDNKCSKIISDTSSYVNGGIRCGDDLFDLNILTKSNNFIENYELNNISSNTPENWESVVDGVCVKDDNGFTKITNGEKYFRKILSSPKTVTVVGYIDSISNAQIVLTGYDNDYNNPYSDIANIDGNGRFRVKSKYAKNIFDIQIKANQGNVTIKSIKAYIGDRAY